MYAKGWGVMQSYSSAKNFYGLACDFGLQDGCSAYAQLNQSGQQF
ncbi:MAG TPA: sel1 repeat family protein, partial [Sulfuricurvum sp.]|nr:sel1 repeat family protein [Sulfuricurvum sp.]